MCTLFAVPMSRMRKSMVEWLFILHTKIAGAQLIIAENIVVSLCMDLRIVVEDHMYHIEGIICKGCLVV